MMLTDLFCESASHTRRDFLAVWGPLVDYLNNGADGAVAAPYRLAARIEVQDKTLDVSLVVDLQRALVVAGQPDPQWETLRCRQYSNINYARWLPGGDAYRFVLGRDKTMSRPGAGPMPMIYQIKADNPVTRQDFRDWAIEGLCRDQKAGNRLLGQPDKGTKLRPDA